MTKTEILNDIAGAYTSATRSLDSRNYCAYLTTDAKRCAVGRYSMSKILDHSCLPVKKFDLKYTLDDHLIVGARGHSMSFWVDCQFLHDTGRFWDSTGLSEAGVHWLKRLLERWHDKD